MLGRPTPFRRPLWSITVLGGMLLTMLAGCAPWMSADPTGIYRIRVDGSQLERIAVEPASPAWSPDGTLVAWSGERAVWLAEASGETPHRLAEAPRAGTPAWSPNGEAIAFVENEQAELQVVAANGTAIASVPLLSPADRQAGGLLPLRNEPTWSPDGGRLAVLGWDGNGTEVYTVNADGSGLARLSSTRASGELINPAAPDSRKKALSDAAHPDWSPDGTRIAYALVPEVARSTGGVYIVRADGRLQRRQTSLVPSAGPLWSPDGRSLLFIARIGGETDVYLMFPQRRTLRNLTNGSDLTPLDIAWSPDGSAIALAADGGIYLLDPETEAIEPLIDTALVDLAPAWSPDGEWIAFRAEADLFRQPSLPVIP